VTEIIRAVSR